MTIKKKMYTIQLNRLQSSSSRMKTNRVIGFKP